MTRIGNRIRKIRIFRNMTQQQLGELIDLDNSRIRKYELGIRTPKENIIKDLAYVLSVSKYALLDPSFDSPLQTMYALFEFEEIYEFDITENNLNNKNPELNTFISLWIGKKQELNDNIIELNDYIEWKLNFERFISDWLTSQEIVNGTRYVKTYPWLG